MTLAKNPECHDRTKHIGTQSHYVREQVGFNMVELTYIAVSRQMLSYNSIYGTMYFLFYFTYGVHERFYFTLCFVRDPVQNRQERPPTTRPHDYIIK